MTKSMEAIIALAKRRGFIYQASEIYGGINGFWDYGPLGAQLKKNLRDAWWQDMILRPCWGRKGPGGQTVRCVPVETRIIQHPKAWVASGHVANFGDPLVDCKTCKQRFRLDHIEEGDYGPVKRDASGKVLCPNDGGELTEPRRRFAGTDGPMNTVLVRRGAGRRCRPTRAG